jgi:hypothetical protein
LIWGGETDKTIVHPVKESKKNPDKKEPKNDGSRGVTNGGVRSV